MQQKPSIQEKTAVANFAPTDLLFKSRIDNRGAKGANLFLEFTINQDDKDVYRSNPNHSFNAGQDAVPTETECGVKKKLGFSSRFESPINRDFYMSNYNFTCIASIYFENRLLAQLVNFPPENETSTVSP